MQDARRRQWEADRARKKTLRIAKLQQKRRELTQARKARSKPCKNAECAKRSMPDSKYCSQECGLIVAAQTYAARELKRVKDTAAQHEAAQRAKLSAWIAANPRFLETAAPSISRDEDLALIAQLEREANELSSSLAAAEGTLEALSTRAKVMDMTSTSKAVLSTKEPDDNRLDCVVCGKEVQAAQFVGHLRECVQRNEEFAHSSVTQNPALCNVLSRRTNRYCLMPKASCAFHSAVSIDYQFVLCGWKDAKGVPCKQPALQCLAHADWREVEVRAARLRVANLRERKLRVEERIVNAQERVAYRGMIRDELKML